MNRTLIACAALALAASTAGAAETPNCDALERETGSRTVFNDSSVDVDGDDLRLTADGRELVHVDAARNLTVAGRSVPVPAESRADLDLYVKGFRQLTREAREIGLAGGKIAGSAVGGLMSVLFTAKTMDDYEKEMEAKGEQIEKRADQLCRTVLDLRRVELSLQARIPAFPNVINRTTIAL